MSVANAISLDIGTFTAMSVSDAEGIHVVFAGECDLTAIQPLDELLRALHDAAVQHAAREVSLDLRAVEFMNSSCLSRVIHWISRVRALPEASRYRIHFRASPQVAWQKRSLEAIRCLAVDLITLDT